MLRTSKEATAATVMSKGSRWMSRRWKVRPDYQEPDLKES